MMCKELNTSTHIYISLNRSQAVPAHQRKFRRQVTDHNRTRRVIQIHNNQTLFIVGYKGVVIQDRQVCRIYHRS